VPDNYPDPSTICRTPPFEGTKYMLRYGCFHLECLLYLKAAPLTRLECNCVDVVNQKVASHGYICVLHLRHTGDGILGVFALAEDALTAALVALRALQVMDWSAVDGLRVVGSDRLDPLRTGTDDSFHHLANHPSTERTPFYYARAVSQPASLAR
jgi:hypothetical protein